MTMCRHFGPISNDLEIWRNKDASGEVRTVQGVHIMVLWRCIFEEFNFICRLAECHLYATDQTLGFVDHSRRNGKRYSKNVTKKDSLRYRPGAAELNTILILELWL